MVDDRSIDHSSIDHRSGSFDGERGGTRLGCYQNIGIPRLGLE